MREYIDDVEKRQQEKAMWEYAEQLVCETCLFGEQCDGINYTPVCLLGDDNRRNAVADYVKYAERQAQTGEFLYDRIISVGIGDFLKRFSAKK